MREISGVRERMMNGGDVFFGLNKIRDKAQRTKIEAERHNKWMDMRGVLKTCPVKWAKSFMEGRQKDYAENYLEKVIAGYGSVDHPHAKPYYVSKNSLYNLGFYKNALGYIRNNY